MRCFLLLSLLVIIVESSRRIRSDEPDLMRLSDEFVGRAMRAIDSRSAELIGKLFFDEIIFITCRRPRGIDKKEIVDTLVNLTYDHVYFVQLTKAERFSGNGYNTIKMNVKLNVFPGSNEVELYVAEHVQNEGKYLILTGQQLNCQ